MTEPIPHYEDRDDEDPRISMLLSGHSASQYVAERYPDRTLSPKTIRQYLSRKLIRSYRVEGSLELFTTRKAIDDYIRTHG